MSSPPKRGSGRDKGAPRQKLDPRGQLVEAEPLNATEARSGAYLRAALDCVVVVDASGRIVEFNPAAERTFGYTREEALGRALPELIVPPSLRERHNVAFARFVETREQRLFGRRLELTGMRADGSEFPVELALSQVEGEPLLVCGALRDISETKQAQDDLRRLADEQGALREVATLVAQGARPAEVFAAVAEKIALVLGVPRIAILRYETDGTATEVGGWSRGAEFLAVGTRWALDEPGLTALVAQTRRPARVDDYSSLPGAVAESVRQAGIRSGVRGIRSGVGAPIFIEGNLWGAVVALSTEPEPLPDLTEGRLGEFTEFVAAAISNTQARDDLRRVADEQAALRRVATLVAREAPPEDLFAAVAKEVALILDVPFVLLHRFESDERSTVIGLWGEPPVRVGARFSLDRPSVMASVRRTGRPARIDDYADVPGPVAAFAREAGIRSAVGAPVVVDDKTWGAIVAAWDEPVPLPSGTEARLADFTELLATALSNTQARDDLHRLAEEQAALRRVATLVAHEATPGDVFAAVAKEVAHILKVPLISLVRCGSDGTATQVGVWGPKNPFAVGTSWTLDEHGVSGLVARTGRPARVDDYAQVPGEIAARLASQAGIRSAVGVPIIVDGTLWGVMMALSTERTPLPEGTEARLAGFTELVATAIANTQARDEARQLADEQAALRRVATLVARRTPPAEVFAAVTEEVGRLLQAEMTQLYRYEDSGTAVSYVANWARSGASLAFPARLTLEGRNLSAMIRDTGAPARIDDYWDVPGSVGDQLVRPLGVRAAIGCPVIVDGNLWGTMAAATFQPEPFPQGAEARLAAFTELVATAISNADTHSTLIASRARIVTAADEARRRIERDLHDGTQQRLVSLGLELQAVKAQIPAELHQVHTELERVVQVLEGVLDDVREISRGLHPASLSHTGLASALRTLARRSSVPVELDLTVEARLPQSIEVAVYYVISEALANAAKHANASVVYVSVSMSEGWLHTTVHDDGVGGAAATAGSGLVGLEDRVEALGGRFLLSSPPGEGTAITVRLPLTDASD